MLKYDNQIEFLNKFNMYTIITIFSVSLLLSQVFLTLDFFFFFFLISQNQNVAGNVEGLHVERCSHANNMVGKKLICWSNVTVKICLTECCEYP